MYIYIFFLFHVFFINPLYFAFWVFSKMFIDMVNDRMQELLVLIILLPISFTILSKTVFYSKKSTTTTTTTLLEDNSDPDYDDSLSWRLAVEANNIRNWPTVPAWCHRHVEIYMTRGQYNRDTSTVVEEILRYVDGISLSDDSRDAWILDVDDTCISNLAYYKEKRFGYVRK